MKNLFLGFLSLILLSAMTLLLPGCPAPQDTACPEGAAQAGSPPPQGLEQWCEKKADTGQIVYHGIYRSWYKSGAKAVEANYKDGRLDGPYVLYWENGMAAKQGSYVAGKEEGEWTFLYENGATRMKGLYQNGLLEGEWSLFDPAGQQTKVRYSAGRQSEQ